MQVRGVLAKQTPCQPDGMTMEDGTLGIGCKFNTASYYAHRDFITKVRCMTMIRRYVLSYYLPLKQNEIPLLQTLEREKRRNLSGTHLENSTNDDAPGWNENLASESEAHVKVKVLSTSRKM